jgi:hypothetical protein
VKLLWVAGWGNIISEIDVGGEIVVGGGVLHSVEMAREAQRAPEKAQRNPESTRESQRRPERPKPFKPM